MAKATAKKPKFELPDDFGDEAEFLADMRRLYQEDVDFDLLNRDAALEDLRFLVGDQWSEDVRQRREAGRKPTLTINRLVAFVAQIVGNRRMNETTIKILPDAAEDVGVARVREGLVRNIQKVSRADIAYDKALENQVACGIGNFKVELDYAGDDVFNQDINIVQIPDALAVVWDRQLIDGSGRDARHCFEVWTMTTKEFKEQYPWATPADFSIDSSLRGDLRTNGWISMDDVRVVAYWRMRTKPRTLALMNTGKTVDVTDSVGDPEVIANIVQHSDGTPVMREVERKYAQMYLCTGEDILEGPYDLPISRVPIFRVPGWEVNVGEWKHRWGLVRFLKDPQRLHNYWRSVLAEKLMMTPRAAWLASDAAVQGRESDWRNAHLSDDPLLIYNSEAGQAPERVAPAQMEQALIAQAEITTQDIRDVSNIHEANLGMPSNEVSGVAIVARQRVSDTGTVLYHDNLNQAIEECGRVINELIPSTYDTPRIIKTLGVDGKQDMQVINDFGNPMSVDITDGRYNVSVVTGPSYATKRLEAAQSMQALINAMPQIAATAADLIVEAQDWPGAEKIAARLRALVPPELLDADEITPEIAQNAEAKGEAQSQAAALATAEQSAKIEQIRANAALALTRARHFGVQAALAPAQADIKAADAASQIQDRQLRGRLEGVRVAEGK